MIRRMSATIRHASQADAAQIAAIYAPYVRDTAISFEIVPPTPAVVAERIDRTRVGDKPVDLPCCGVFQLEGGKIKLWRDYFDLGTYRNALGA